MRGKSELIGCNSENIGKTVGPKELKKKPILEKGEKQGKTNERE